ncbi:M20 family metallopeptidase [Gulosibacter chungangensis]|uniref:M20 family metallopeptidase n=1 Tax=Gulosibacter chungangensis TaxID=979746 RepID=UPI001CE3B63F|nr:M20 family metallopeptidase [Gulosibacter chungangensis]
MDSFRQAQDEAFRQTQGGSAAESLAVSEAEATSADTREALEARVLERIDPEAIAQLASDLIRAESENPGGTEEATAQRLGVSFRVMGAQVDVDYVEPGRPNLVVRMGPNNGEGGILFLGHSDVVPAGEGWSGDPFIPRREGDDIIGRGATDMKGGIASVVAAMHAVNAEAPEIPMTFVCTVDEEVDARGARHYIQTVSPANYAGCVVAEPTSLVTITAARGATNLRVDIEGASAHAGKPEEGASAIYAAADVIALIEADHKAIHDTAHPVLGSGDWNVGMIEGGHGTSIVPDRCTLSIDRRTLPDEHPEAILEQLLDAARTRTAEKDRPGADRIHFTGEVEMTMPGFLTDPESDFVCCVRDAVREVGGNGDAGVWSAACEGGFMAQHHKTPTIVLGPGDITGQAHQPDERVSVTELHTAARAFALIALRIGAVAGGPTQG